MWKTLGSKSFKVDEGVQGTFCFSLNLYHIFFFVQYKQIFLIAPWIFIILILWTILMYTWMTVPGRRILHLPRRGGRAGSEDLTGETGVCGLAGRKDLSGKWEIYKNLNIFFLFSLRLQTMSETNLEDFRNIFQFSRCPIFFFLKYWIISKDRSFRSFGTFQK